MHEALLAIKWLTNDTNIQVCDSIAITDWEPVGDSADIALLSATSN